MTLQEGGDAVPLAINNAYRNANLWWSADRGGAAIKNDGEKTEGGATYDVLTITPKGGKPFDAWFDVETHLLYRIAETQGAQVMTTTHITNYRSFDGTSCRPSILVDQPGRSEIRPAADSDEGRRSSPSPSRTRPMRRRSRTVARFLDRGRRARPTFPFDLINNHIHAEVDGQRQGPVLLHLRHRAASTS